MKPRPAGLIVGAYPAMTPCSLQPGEPRLHGAARDAEHPGVLAHAGLRLLEEEVQQIEVKLIQLHKSTAPEEMVYPGSTEPMAQ